MADRRVLANEKLPDFLMQFGIFFFFLGNARVEEMNVAHQSPSQECEAASSEFTVPRASSSLVNFMLRPGMPRVRFG